MTPNPPPAPGLVSEYLDWGNWLFRWRSYPPLIILAVVLALVALEPGVAGGAAWRDLWAAAGLSLGALGLVVRAKTLGHVPLGTSGRGTKELRAETLNTEGFYSVVRHPLYLGNYFLWVGVPVLAGKPALILMVTLAFWLYYERIMMAEERYVLSQHGEAFRAWASRTPAFVPRLGGWVPSPHPFSLRFCLGRDYQALFGFVAATTAVVVVRSGVAGAGWIPTVPWIAYFAAGTLAYAVLHVLKRRTRILEPPDDR